MNNTGQLKVPVVKWLSFLEIDTMTLVQILDKAVFISHSSNTFEKSINPTILLLAMGKF